MGLPTSVKIHFSNRCRTSGVRSIHPPFWPPQRQAAENLRFRGLPLIRLRRRNRRPHMLPVPMPPLLAMMLARLSKVETWLEAGLWYKTVWTFEIYDIQSYNPTVPYQLASCGKCFENDQISSRTHAQRMMDDAMNAAYSLTRHCNPVITVACITFFFCITQKLQTKKDRRPKFSRLYCNR